MLGLFFPELSGAARFRALGGDYLDREKLHEAMAHPITLGEEMEALPVS